MTRPGRRGLVAAAAALWFCALAAFAVWTRGPLLREGLWIDEAISAFVAESPTVSEFLFRNRTSDYTPPLFNVLLAGYTRVAGAGEMPLKLFAFAWGVLAAAAGVALAAELGGLLAAAMAAAFLVNNPILIDMSTELFEFRGHTRIKQMQHLLATRQIDDRYFWTDAPGSTGGVDGDAPGTRPAAAADSDAVTLRSS